MRVTSTVTPGSWRTSDASSSARGYGARWRRERGEFLRANRLCTYECKRQGVVTPATVVDHWIPHEGDEELFWNRKNWRACCASCHSGWKQRLEAEWKKRGNVGSEL